ncbi:MAG: RDD family protein [Cyclobacteriaceae bacterium]
MADSNYASFGIRWLAHLIDFIIIYVVNLFVIIPIMGAVGFGIASSNDFDLESMTEGDIIASFIALMSALVAGSLIAYAIRIVYGAALESSKHQATLGKMAVGIKVTDTNGGRLTFVKALLRAIGKILSGIIIFIGYIMAAFTDKKQGLHDMIAGSVVVKK